MRNGSHAASGSCGRGRDRGRDRGPYEKRDTLPVALVVTVAVVGPHEKRDTLSMALVVAVVGSAEVYAAYRSCGCGCRETRFTLPVALVVVVVDLPHRSARHHARLFVWV